VQSLLASTAQLWVCECGGGAHSSRSSCSSRLSRSVVPHSLQYSRLTGNSTAYRLWSSRGDPIPDDPDPAAIPATGEATSAITSAIPSAITSALTREVLPPGSTKPAGTVGSPVSSKGTLSEEPPPPAYEESVRPTTGTTGTGTGAGTGRVSETEEWVDMDEVRGSSIPITAPSIVLIGCARVRVVRLQIPGTSAHRNSATRQLSLQLQLRPFIYPSSFTLSPPSHFPSPNIALDPTSEIAAAPP
jgi:hypothetical protein